MQLRSRVKYSYLYREQDLHLQLLSVNLGIFVPPGAGS